MGLPRLKIKGFTLNVPIMQGGMGVGVSLHPLALEAAKHGGFGTVSSAALDRLVSRETGKRVDSREAAYIEVSKAKEGGGYAGINIMWALQRDYEKSVLGAIDAGADAIISGAGLPLTLPKIAKSHPGFKDTALIPIVSSARALEIICRIWEKQGYKPDAAVLEGPLAGGHIGWDSKTIRGYESEEKFYENYALDALLRSEERRVGKECRSRWSPYH